MIKHFQLAQGKRWFWYFWLEKNVLRDVFILLCMVVCRVVRMADFTNLREVLYNTVHSCLTLFSNELYVLMTCRWKDWFVILGLLSGELSVWYLNVLYQASTHFQNGLPCIITFTINYYDLKSDSFLITPKIQFAFTFYVCYCKHDKVCKTIKKKKWSFVSSLFSLKMQTLLWLVILNIFCLDKIKE